MLDMLRAQIANAESQERRGRHVRVANLPHVDDLETRLREKLGRTEAGVPEVVLSLIRVMIALEKRRRPEE